MVSIGTGTGTTTSLKTYVNYALPLTSVPTGTTGSNIGTVTTGKTFYVTGIIYTIVAGLSMRIRAGAGGSIVVEIPASIATSDQPVQTTFSLGNFPKFNSGIAIQCTHNSGGSQNMAVTLMGFEV